MSSTPVGEYYHSGTPMNLTVTGKSGTFTPKATAAVDVSGEDVSHSSFLRWRQEMQNRYVVQNEKILQVERKAFKEEEDKRFAEQKKALHEQTIAEFGRAKEKVEALKKSNLARGEEYKQDLAVMKDLVKRQHEEWAQFGKELTVEFGEQVERTKQSLIASREHKADIGRQVREEEEALKKRLQSQRAEFMEEARQHVQHLKEEEIGKTDEAMTFALRQRQNKVEKVKRTERSWAEDTKGQRDAFLGHARENKERADSTKELMRTSRKELVKKNNKTAREERQRKEEDAASLAEKKAAMMAAKAAAHDMVYTNRKVSPEKVRMMKDIVRSKSPEKAAAKAGVIAPPPRSPPSPYKSKAKSR